MTSKVLSSCEKNLGKFFIIGSNLKKLGNFFNIPKVFLNFWKVDSTMILLPNKIRGMTLCLLLTLLPFSALALTAEERLSDPAKEQQAHEIFKQLRCVVCSGESINDSKADIAKSLRVLVREKISEGSTEQQILSEITNSYGDSVLMKPPVNQKTFILWIGPAVILLIGVAFLALFFRQKLDK